jgi:hypothetical protein
MTDRLDAPALRVIPTPSTSHEELLDSKRAAKRLAISERHLWTITRSGRLRSIRIDRCVRYRPADLDAFIESCRTDAKGA